MHSGGNALLHISPLPHLQNTFMCRMLLELNQAIQDNQLHIVVALLDDQVNIALCGRL